jgi:hypothetical protein
MSSSPDFSNWDRHHWITYGPNENCTLALCPIEDSIFEYQPSLAANAVFIALFGITLIIHLIQFFRWRTWFFSTAILWGCITEMIGYGGRIIMWQNPFSFPGFIMQIGELASSSLLPSRTTLLEIEIRSHDLRSRHTVCITIGPAFYSAAIYFTLTQMSVLPPLHHPSAPLFSTQPR